MQVKSFVRAFPQGVLLLAALGLAGAVHAGMTTPAATYRWSVADGCLNEVSNWNLINGQTLTPATELPNNDDLVQFYNASASTLSLASDLEVLCLDVNCKVPITFDLNGHTLATRGNLYGFKSGDVTITNGLLGLVAGHSESRFLLDGGTIRVCDGGQLFAAKGVSLSIGTNGKGSQVFIEDGGILDGSVGIGSGNGNAGRVTVSGANALFVATNGSTVTVGATGKSAELIITNNAVLRTSGSFAIGAFANDYGFSNRVYVADGGKIFLTTSGQNFVGRRRGSNTLSALSHNVLEVGPGGLLDVTGGLRIGGYDKSYNYIDNGNTLLVNGGAYTNASTTYVGAYGSYNSFVITNGASVHIGTLSMNPQPNGIHHHNSFEIYDSRDVTIGKFSSGGVSSTVLLDNSTVTNNNADSTFYFNYNSSNDCLVLRNNSYFAPHDLRVLNQAKDVSIKVLSGSTLVAYPTGSGEYFELFNTSMRVADGGKFQLNAQFVSNGSNQRYEVLDGGIVNSSYPIRLNTAGGNGSSVVVSNGTINAKKFAMNENSYAGCTSTLEIYGTNSYVHSTSDLVAFGTNTTVTINLPAEGFSRTPIDGWYDATHAGVSFAKGSALRFRYDPKFALGRRGSGLWVCIVKSSFKLDLSKVTLDIPPECRYELRNDKELWVRVPSANGILLIVR